MNDLALIVIGLLFGLVLAVVSGAAGFLFYTAVQMRKENADTQRQTSSVIADNTSAIDRMRGEVSTALTQMDAQRLYEASVAVQKNSKQLSQIIGHLNRIVFSVPTDTPSMPQMPGFNLEDEASDDARMLEERNRWLAGQSPDITPEQVQDFFANRRRNGVFSVGSTPPAVGAYQSIAEEQIEKPVSTLPDLDDGNDLTEIGEY